MAQEVQKGKQDGKETAEDPGNLWLSCFFLRNLPDGVSSQQVSAWVSKTFHKDCLRVAYADESSRDRTSSGSYLIELTSPSARSIFSRQGRGEHFFFPIHICCEEVRSEQFARKFSVDSFPVSQKTMMQLFQGCLGEAVKQSKYFRGKFMMEFSSEESVARVLKAFDSQSSILAVPVKLQAVKKRAESFARRCLLEADRVKANGTGLLADHQEWAEKNNAQDRGSGNDMTTQDPPILSELVSLSPPPLFPDPIHPPRYQSSEPSFDFQALLPHDGDRSAEQSPGELGLPFMLNSLLPPRSEHTAETDLLSFIQPFPEEATGSTPEDPACLLPLMLDSVSSGDRSVQPWGGLTNQTGLETMWNENFRTKYNSSGVDSGYNSGGVTDFEQKLYASERENAVLIEQARKAKRETQNLRNELLDRDRIIEELRKELREKEYLLAELKKTVD
eukprot:scaffold3046_cov105-Cylindrotheca_fusiformis.AAC.4